MNEGELRAGLAQTPSYRYADLVGGRQFERYRVETADECQALVNLVRSISG